MPLRSETFIKDARLVRHARARVKPEDARRSASILACRIATPPACHRTCRLEACDTADEASALRQARSLRYGRRDVCATVRLPRRTRPCLPLRVNESKWWREYAELIALFFIHGMAMGMWFVPLGSVLDGNGYTTSDYSTVIKLTHFLTIPYVKILQLKVFLPNLDLTFLDPWVV